MQVVSEPLGRRIATLENVERRLTRWALALVLLALGIYKFTATEAAAIKPLVAHSPFLGWAYRVASVQAVSDAIGSMEIVIGVFLLVHRVMPRAAAVGGVLACGTFLTTLSFLATTPRGAVDASMMGFLLKDVFLFAAALRVTIESLQHAQRLSLSRATRR
jgi:reactive chlorine resistance protein C